MKNFLHSVLAFVALATLVSCDQPLNVMGGSGVSSSRNASSAKTPRIIPEISFFSFDSIPATGYMEDKTINVTVPYGIDITKLSATVEITAGIVTPDPAEPRNYTSPVAFSVKNAAGRGTDYTVKVTIAPEGQYFVVFYPNSAKGIMEQQTVYASDFSVTLQGNKFVNEGFSFVGWNTEKDGSGDQYTDQADFVPENAQNTALYAQWTAKLYTVTLDNSLPAGQKSQNNSDEEPVTLEVVYGEPMPEIPAPQLTVAGYTFGGYVYRENKMSVPVVYYTNEMKSARNWDIDSDATLQIDWIADSYEVIFDKNDSAAVGVMDSQEFVHGTKNKLPENGFYKPGWVFTGWNTKPDGDGVAFDSGREVSVLTDSTQENITLYAQWQSNMVLLETPEFQAGNDKIQLSSYLVSKYEVTQSDWAIVMEGNLNGISTNPSKFDGKANNPVEQISWYEAIVYSNRLSRREGRTPCYSYENSTLDDKTDTDGWGAVSAAWDVIVCDFEADGYRLPTEAEWEYAARTGETTQYYWGNDASVIGDYAWYDGNSKLGLPASDSNYGTHPVGKKIPNRFDLYDTAGNVWEWCWDWYGARSYPSGLADPIGPIEGTYRVVRSGSWNFAAPLASATYRYDYKPSAVFEYVGLRVVASLSAQTKAVY